MDKTLRRLVRHIGWDLVGVWAIGAVVWGSFFGDDILGWVVVGMFAINAIWLAALLLKNDRYLKGQR